MTNPLNVRVDTDMTCLEWLKLHGYQDIAKLIEGLTRNWKDAGKKTRRDWWVILAGTPSGNPRTVHGFTFPVLKAARRRQGFPPNVADAIERTPHELAPSITQQEARWGRKFKRAMR